MNNGTTKLIKSIEQLYLIPLLSIKPNNLINRELPTWMNRTFIIFKSIYNSIGNNTILIITNYRQLNSQNSLTINNPHKNITWYVDN